MNLNVSGHHLEVTPAILSYVRSKLERITRHFDHVIDAHVILTVNKAKQKAEVTLHVRGKDLHCESEEDDLYAAIGVGSGLQYGGPYIDPVKAGLQAYQAMVALGSGGVTGVGLGDGRQKLGFIPEHHTDFIFSVIGEELGLIATVGIVLAFVLVVGCGLYIACYASDTFGMLLAAGITFLIGFQAVINIGVVTGSLPNKGISLPFLSYGGSNLVVMLASVGLLINVARHGREPNTNPFALVDELASEIS